MQRIQTPQTRRDLNFLGGDTLLDGGRSENQPSLFYDEVDGTCGRKQGLGNGFEI